MDKVRIDKWVWSVRIYKSRSMAIDACKSGHIKVDDTIAKPSTTVHAGQIVSVRKDGFQLTFKILDLIDRRVAAPIAQACYDDLTPDDERNKYKDWFVGKAKAERRLKGAGRPTKKERRVLDDYKDGSNA